MKKNKILPGSILILLIILLTKINIFGQNVSPESVVDVSSNSTIKKNKAGTEISSEIILSIKDSWHINANIPLEESLTPTVVKFDQSKDFAVQNIKYPPAKMVKLPFSNSELALYKTQAKIKVVLLVDKKFTGKKLNIKGTLQYQPCNDETCLFPVNKPFSMDVKLK